MNAPQYRQAEDKHGAIHCLIDGKPQCDFDAADAAAIYSNRLITCQSCLRQLRHRRQALEATFPKCGCGATIGKLRSEAGKTDCVRCAERKVDLLLVDQLRARVAELEAENAQLSNRVTYLEGPGK